MGWLGCNLVADATRKADGGAECRGDRCGRGDEDQVLIPHELQLRGTPKRTELSQAEPAWSPDEDEAIERIALVSSR